ncbi:hypothetical protein Q8F55_001158 [Vanrija albida]|uniref:Invertebrate defensins family profile domain-containing protein n=1 Tax=Vanrija albida TaxID=181172 RepID=A0ABR3QF97_9TREE
MKLFPTLLLLATAPLAAAWPVVINPTVVPRQDDASANDTCYPDCVYLPDPRWCSDKCGQDWVRGGYRHQWCGWLSFQCCC